MKYRINHAKVVMQANEINDQAQQLSAQIRQLEQLEQMCRSAWQGQAADIFLQKVSGLRAEMFRTKSQISTLASTIRYCADRIQREDMEAERRAAALKSGQ